MEQNRKIEEELERFTKLWNDKPHSVKRHTKELWDIRADSWENGLQNDAARRKRSDLRISTTADFLRAHGLLGANDDVIDIGCGPGRFVAEFSKTSNHVTGTDLSPRMLEHAADFASSQGIGNVSFTACDFKQADIDALGWRNRFDLVFTSITPAVSHKKDLEKAMSMSRGWCFNSSFINGSDGLLTDISRNVFGKEPLARWDGRVFYALFNILWLRGFCPYVTYYTEKSDDIVEAGMLLAQELADNIGISSNDADSVEKIYRYIMENADNDGKLTSPFESTYVWMLWDVRTQLQRDYFEL
ncbi:class I SAM-dependent methyltransferase [Anaerovorax odorimutans]|uniref:class I SAM-dependent methyltransferase n=1 Tax=Anaerovorax odorimutans TaxID=109327 RepID=UPI00042477D7|nr:class I SAM-dependent methyltransferase [Anaerovorax odorimutans]